MDGFTAFFSAGRLKAAGVATITLRALPGAGDRALVLQQLRQALRPQPLAP